MRWITPTRLKETTADINYLTLLWHSWLSRKIRKETWNLNLQRKNNKTETKELDHEHLASINIEFLYKRKEKGRV